MKKNKNITPFEKVVYHRKDSGKRHILLALVKLSVSAMLSRSITGQAIADWGRFRSRKELKQMR